MRHPHGWGSRVPEPICSWTTSIADGLDHASFTRPESVCVERMDDGAWQVRVIDSATRMVHIDLEAPRGSRTKVRGRVAVDP